MANNIKLGLKLFVITAVVGLALAFVNSVTAPVVAENQAQKLKESLSEVYPADSYDEIEVADKPDSIKNVYHASSAEGDGYIFQINVIGGYGGDIEYLLAVGDDNNILGFAPLEHSESAGFGAEMEQAFFKEGMVGVSMGDEVGFSDSGSENEIVGISGATISTSTIVKGINDAREVLTKIN